MRNLLISVLALSSIALATSHQEAVKNSTEPIKNTSSAKEEPNHVKVDGKKREGARKRNRQAKKRRRQEKASKKEGERELASSITYPGSCEKTFEDNNPTYPLYDTEAYAECANNKAFYPIHWGGPSTDETIGCMHILQSD
jgi:hypothetical protein